MSRALSPPGTWPPNDIKKVVDEVNKISHKAFGEEEDLIGRVYEYFLKEFAVNATKEEGEYYAPHNVVQLIAAMPATLRDCWFRPEDRAEGD